MNLNVKLCILILASPFLILTSHLLISRMRINLSPQISAFKAILISYLPMALFSHLCFFRYNSVMATTELFSGATYLVVVHSCVAYAYFHLFNMSETSQRIRMLYEIYMAGALTPEQIFSVFKPTEIIDVRLKRLIDLNQIALKNHSYIVKGKILYYAALLIMRWRDLLGFEPIETKNSC